MSRSLVRLITLASRLGWPVLCGADTMTPEEGTGVSDRVRVEIRVGLQVARLVRSLTPQRGPGQGQIKVRGWIGWRRKSLHPSSPFV
ncbi:hypothetical protein BKA65DRAFT_503426, partial [Rhexocercosporidium sp. MPI-PUGE-AT-0058]